MSFFIFNFATVRNISTAMTEQNSITPLQKRLTIRISSDHLSFSASNASGSDVTYDPYTVKNGISMAANMREALKTSQLLEKEYERVTVMIDSPVLLVPASYFTETEHEIMYSHSFPSQSADKVLYNILPEFNAVAIYSINKDLKLVIDDKFPKARFTPSSAIVWRHLQHRSHSGVRNKLFAYFHDKKLEVVSFSQRRFKFFNTFDANGVNDSLYFILYIWKQLMLNPEHDEVQLVGEIPFQETLMEELEKYLNRVSVINADHGDTPIMHMPYDLAILFSKK